MKALKEAPGKDVSITGSPTLVRTLLREGLLDEHGDGRITLEDGDNGDRRLFIPGDLDPDRGAAIEEAIWEKMHFAQQLRTEFLRSLLAASLASDLCTVVREGEEAFIGALFQNLGRMLAGFYLPDEARRHRRLCELNVIEQVLNASQTTVVREAWARGQPLALHGWIYDVGDGLLRDLDMCLTAPQ